MTQARSISGISPICETVFAAAHELRTLVANETEQPHTGEILEQTLRYSRQFSLEERHSIIIREDTVLARAPGCFASEGGELDETEAQIRTVREHFAMVWNDLSVLKQLFLQHPCCGLEDVEVDYGWWLLRFNREDIC